MSNHRLYSEKTLFFADLDSTLIYSHRHAHDDSCVWVEELHGHPQSFMTAKAYRYFSAQDWLNTVPLTTRTEKQYARLSGLADTMHWRDALICNGAILLTPDGADAGWRAESERLAAGDYAELCRMQQIAAHLAGADAVISAEPFLFYIRAEDAEALYHALKPQADLTHLSVYRDKRKVYIVSRAMRKGNAAKRYAKRIGAESFYAAGDSKFDLSMLNAAEIGICPAALTASAKPSGRLIGCEGRLSDALCDVLDAGKEIGIDSRY